MPAVVQNRNPLAPYRVFVGTVGSGPHAGLTLVGPLVLGSNGRIQVIGFLFQRGGPRLTVVGTVFGGGVALRVVLPTGGAFEISGAGTLQRVRGGLPGGLSLVGSGNLAGPDRNDHGAWQTVRPDRA